MQVKFIDLQRQYLRHKEQLDQAIHVAIQSFNFLKGPLVSSFEETFSALIGVRNTIATGNGTDALFAALKCLGVSSGDEVITPAFSWISSAETISLCNGTPVFADIDPLFYTIDPELVEQKITKCTKGIVAVHLYGQPAEVNSLKTICLRHGLFLIEDCAQAHLTEYDGKRVGSFGDAGAFSFYPTKNLGAYGDAGCVVTSNDMLAEKIRRYINHGALTKDDHLFEGTNSRMDSVQASVLLAKMNLLKSWNEQRLRHALSYNNQLKGIEGIITPEIRKGATHSFHIYNLRVKNRSALRDYLSAQGIETGVHYPKALPNLPAYAHLNHKAGAFPIATTLQEEALSLPIYPELTEAEITYVSENIKAFYRK
jgi:dTDP-4-amino-4,6-dideoxygalactose transaminase